MINMLRFVSPTNWSVVSQIPRPRETMHRADEGAFAATIAQERLKIDRRRRLAEGAGAGS
jgi:hypothetical protein